MGTLAKSNSSNGFFSFLTPTLEGLAQGGAVVTSQILPRFAAKELLDQREDQLSNPTFVFQPGTPPNSQFGTTTETVEPQRSGLLFDNINVTATGLIVASIAAVAVVLLVRMR